MQKLRKRVRVEGIPEELRKAPHLGAPAAPVE
jgi:hypothetical protein